MSVRTIAAKDFLGVRRSRAIWAVVTVLALGAALLAYTYRGFDVSGTREVQQLFRTLATALSIILPIVALVASYMAIVGERAGGGIKFLLGFPNTRRDVLLGKLASRVGVVWGMLLFMFGTAACVAIARHGVLPIVTVLGLFAVSLVYGSVFVTIAVAMSAGIASRSRAIAAAVTSYLVLVLLYAVPTFRFTTIVRFVHQVALGFEPNVDLYNAVTYTSPYTAYRKAMNLVLPEEMESKVFRRATEGGGEAAAQASTDLPVYLTDEFSLVVLAVWIVVPLAIGYLRFERADIA